MIQNIFIFLFFSGSSTKSKIELRGGSSNSEGNVFVNGQPVCDDMWDKNDADVACRMLGYVYTIMTHFFKILFIDIHRVSQQPNQNLDLFLLSSSLMM